MRAVWGLSLVGAAILGCVGEDAGRSGQDAVAPVDGGSSTGVDAGGVDARAPDHELDADADAGLAPPCEATDSSLVLCFPFEGSAVDLASNANLVISQITFATGQIEQGAVFNGTSSSITLTPFAKLDAITNFTVEAFVRPTAIPATGRAGVLDSEARFALFLTPTGFRCLSGSGNDQVNTTVPLTVGKTTHLACTSDGTTLKAYQDGVLVQIAPITAIPAATDATLAIGINDPSGDHYSGMLDELRVYSRARSDTEIAADSARGR